MPITKQATKKMLSDRKRTIVNTGIREKFKKLVKMMRKKPSKNALSQAYTALDKAAKKNIIHPNKAARTKSRLSQLLRKSK